MSFDDAPQTWATSLQEYFVKSEVVYATMGNDEARRRYATLTLAGLFQRLEQANALHGLLHLHVFRDMLDFLDDLHRGRDNPWRSLGPFGGLQQYTKTEERIRTHALVGVEIMIDAAGAVRGAKKRAFEYVAGLAASSGHDISAARIKGLYYEYTAGRFPHPRAVQVFVSNFWMGDPGSGEIAVCEHGHPVHRCPASGGERCSKILDVAEKYLPGLFVSI